ncbi:hypothetical protein D4S03_06430 [bacterium]|nr:MAG: hypothetical protein D4S03_06430 [bacterium]
MVMKSRRDKLPPFVALPWEILNSMAYKDFPQSAAKALPYFLGKPKLTWNHPERCSTEFTFSYPEAKRHGFATATFSRIINDLTRHGFIDLTGHGGLRGKGKGYNRFRLSNRWQKYVPKKPTVNKKRLSASLSKPVGNGYI